MREFHVFAGLVFLCAGSLHLWRAYTNSVLVIGEYTIPVSVSWAIGVLAVGLAFWAFKTAGKH